MPVWRLQVEWSLDTLLPRDVLMITPHFDDQDALTSPQDLCDDLAAALDDWDVGQHQIEVTAYDAQGSQPVFPQGHAIINEGEATAATCPREVALCLSFYSERPLPRQRGRLYIPFTFVTGSAPGAVRPSGAWMQRVADLAPIFQDLGGTEVDWCVYSRADDQARPVTNWFVDDEWDTVRSRGLRPSSRLAGTTGEA